MQVLTEKFAAMVLASMTHLSTPGNTIFSQVPITTCDSHCQETELCSNKNNWKCKKPQFSQELFDLYKDKEKSFTKPESFDEGIVRYAMTSEIISNISKKYTIDKCINKCLDDSCKNSCESNLKIQNKRQELAMLIAVVTNQESDFRLDVQGGTGNYGRGDCQWKLSDGKTAKAFQKHAKPIKSTCKSVCLGQIKIGHGMTPNNWSADDLVGVDYASTERCITTVAEYILKAEELCHAKYSKSKNWYKSIFSAYGTGISCLVYKNRFMTASNDVRIKEFAYMTPGGVFWGTLPPDGAISKEPLEELWPSKRANILSHFVGNTLQPSKDIIEILNTDRSKALYAALTNTEKRYWLPSNP